jgi:hypothetical protein
MIRNRNRNSQHVQAGRSATFKSADHLAQSACLCCSFCLARVFA